MTEKNDPETLLTAQRTAFESDPYPSLALRRDRLDRIGRLLKENEQAICAAVCRDFGHRSPHETTMLEIVPLMAAIRHTRAHLTSWMKPERRARSLEFLLLANQVHHQPLGVVGIMVPWNYPVFLAFGPLIDIVAAGNRALIKPSELVPETSSLIAALVARYFSPEEVAVVEGGIEVAAAFAALPFDHLIFTGSTAVGRKVMAAAAANLTPVTLELGGKSPTVIAPDYDLAQAARDIVFGKLMNAGQTCIAPDYILVDRARLHRLVSILVAETERCYPKQGAASDYSGLVGRSALERLRGALRECVERGVRIETADIGLPQADLSMLPTFVVDPPVDCRLMQDEIFGPVLPVVPYDTLTEAIAFIRARPRPLALYLFSRDKETQRTVLDRTISGNVTINGTLLHVAQNDLPFGGVGPSGIGAYHGHDGFKRFSHARGIARVRLFNPTRLAMPPYGRLAALLGKFMGRR